MSDGTQVSPPGDQSLLGPNQYNLHIYTYRYLKHKTHTHTKSALSGYLPISIKYMQAMVLKHHDFNANADHIQMALYH